MEVLVDNTRDNARAPVAPYADTGADNRLLKRKPSKYESPLISYTGITLMKLTNVGTMDRETLPWLSVLNRRLQSRVLVRPSCPPFPSLSSPLASVNLHHSSRSASDATRCDETRRHRRKSGDVKCVAARMKKATIRSHTSLTGD